MHFFRPDSYVRVMPPYIPWHLALVYVTGAAEIAGGLGLLLPLHRRAAAWGLIALLVAVFPANNYMATDPAQAGADAIPRALLWARLPLQPLLIWWVFWFTRD